MSVRQVRLRVRGKVNLSLRVLGRRLDGYHDIESVAVPVGLADTLTVRATPWGIHLRCPWVSCSPQDNLAWKAAEAFLEQFPELGGVDIEIAKEIPVGGGMGGASADAAGVLIGAWRLAGEPGSAQVLQRIARLLGADVPMFLHVLGEQGHRSGAFVLRGRGDDVLPLPGRRRAPLHLVLVLMNFPVDTGWAYARWDAFNGIEGTCGRDHHAGPRGTGAGDGTFADPRTASVAEAICAGDDASVASLVFNDLEEPVASEFPVISEVKRALIMAGALGAVMTGSGSTVLGLVAGPEHGVTVCREFGRVWRRRGAGRQCGPNAPDVSELVLVDEDQVLGRWRLS